MTDEEDFTEIARLTEDSDRVLWVDADQEDLKLQIEYEGKVMMTKTPEEWLKTALILREMKNKVSGIFWDTMGKEEGTLDEVLGYD